MKLDFEQAKKILKESVENADTPFDMYMAFFDKIYEQGYKDGFSVIEDIKAEIENLDYHKAQFITADGKSCVCTLDVLAILDKHINGKENTDADNN